MGWTWYTATHYKNGKVDRKSECDNLFDCEKIAVVKSCMVGSTYYAALRNIITEETFAVVVLTRTDSRSIYNFGYKAMGETEVPYYFDCPMSILNLLTDTDNKSANEYRALCREAHRKKSENPKLGSLRAGSIVEFCANEKKYIATKTYGAVYLDCNDRIKRIKTYWNLDNTYTRASSRCINSWGFTVIHIATKEEEEILRNIHIENIMRIRGR